MLTMVPEIVTRLRIDRAEEEARGTFGETIRALRPML
jgi:hypothetical protein